jgi:hypothetical protein
MGCPSTGLSRDGDALVGRQDDVPTNDDAPEKDGSWLSDDGNDRTGDRNYGTAMAVLALTVEYRYLPIYQR